MHQKRIRQAAVLRRKMEQDPRYALLRTLSESELPREVDEPERISELASLDAAGFVEVTLPAQRWVGGRRVWTEAALVHRITRIGQAAVDQFRQLSDRHDAS